MKTLNLIYIYIFTINLLEKIDEALGKAQTLEVQIMETWAFDTTNIKEVFYDLLKEMYKEISKKLEIVESQAET